MTEEPFLCQRLIQLGAKQTAQKVYSKVYAKVGSRPFSCGVEEVPTQTDGHFCPGISSTPHKMAWNRLWHRHWNTPIYVDYLAP